MLKTNQNRVKTYHKHHERIKTWNAERKGILNKLYISIKLNNLPSKDDYDWFLSLFCLVWADSNGFFQELLTSFYTISSFPFPFFFNYWISFFLKVSSFFVAFISSKSPIFFLYDFFFFYNLKRQVVVKPLMGLKMVY
jgi:hypothetical protein